MIVGLDVGGTKIDAVCIGEDNRVSSRVRLATGHGVSGVVASIGSALEALMIEEGRREISSLGIGIPGIVSPGTTLVRHSVNLGVDELDLALALAHVTDAPIRVENDVKAAALGAYALREERSSMAYLNLGTGVAAGIVVAGELWSGARGGAGEVGHLSVDPNGPLCKCGQRGCVEALCGGAAVAARWQTDAPLPVLDLFDAADAGDALALEIRSQLALGIAGGIRALALTVDVETIVLGGGVSALGNRLEALVREQLRNEGANSAFLASLALDERMELLPPGSAAAALGAALIGAQEQRNGALAHG